MRRSFSMNALLGLVLMAVAARPAAAEPCIADAFEDNDSADAAAPLSLPTNIEGTICGADSDYFSFSACTTGPLTVTFTSSPLSPNAVGAELRSAHGERRQVPSNQSVQGNTLTIVVSQEDAEEFGADAYVLGLSSPWGNAQSENVKASLDYTLQVICDGSDDGEAATTADGTTTAADDGTTTADDGTTTADDAMTTADDDGTTTADDDATTTVADATTTADDDAATTAADDDGTTTVADATTTAADDATTTADDDATTTAADDDGTTTTAGAFTSANSDAAGGTTAAGGPTDSSKSSQSSASATMAPIAGAAVGGLVLIAVIVLLVAGRRRRKANDDNEKNPPLDDMPTPPPRDPNSSAGGSFIGRSYLDPSVTTNNPIYTEAGDAGESAYVTASDVYGNNNATGVYLPPVGRALYDDAYPLANDYEDAIIAPEQQNFGAEYDNPLPARDTSTGPALYDNPHTPAAGPVAYDNPHVLKAGRTPALYDNPHTPAAGPVAYDNPHVLKAGRTPALYDNPASTMAQEQEPIYDNAPSNSASPSSPFSHRTATEVVYDDSMMCDDNEPTYVFGNDESTEATYDFGDNDNNEAIYDNPLREEDTGYLETFPTSRDSQDQNAEASPFADGMGEDEEDPTYDNLDPSQGDLLFSVQ